MTNFFSHTLYRKFWFDFLKKVLIDNHYKTIYEPVRSECSSYMELNKIKGLLGR